MFYSFFRYDRILVHFAAWYFARPVTTSSASLLSNKDTTVIIPTICSDDELNTLLRTLKSISRTNPQSIVIVTPDSRLEAVSLAAKAVNRDIMIIGSKYKDKRRQITLGISHLKTSIAIFADDDVEWRGGEKFMPSLLAPFACMYTGAVGTCQRVERTRWWSLVEYLGAIYVTRRNQETVATSRIDGGISCLSGRTLAIRASIVKQPWFRQEYVEETWNGRRLNPDDDNFITRWCWKQGYSICIQSHEDAVIYTTFGDQKMQYLYRCVRWERSRLRHTFQMLKKPRILLYVCKSTLYVIC